MPRFSIVLPTHNRADVLPFAIRSALWQTECDFELLIAGDGCTDGTKDVVASFGDPRIRWLDLPKAPGIGYRNRNVALRQASGAHIAYLGHDDLWFPDHLERLGLLLDATGAEFVYSRILAANLDGWMMPSVHNLEIPAHRATVWRGELSICMSSVVHARSCLARYGYWDEDLPAAADAEMWHRLFSAAGFQNVAFLSEPTAVRFVARRRATAAQRARSRAARWLLHGLMDETLPGALKLTTEEGRTQQEALWERLSSDPPRRVAEIRRGVVQYHDALLWKARTVAGLVGLRAGFALSAVLIRIWKSILWLCLGRERRVARMLQAKTRALEKRRRQREPG